MTYGVNFKKVRKNVDWWQVFHLTTDGTAPIDLSTAVLRMTVVPKLGTPTPVLSLSLGSGLRLVTDGTDGKFAIDVAHTAMEAVPVGSYKYDLVLDRAGASEVLMEGSVKIVAGVTDI